jgi:trehalose 6-phosphate synthase/phosphatase
MKSDKDYIWIHDAHLMMVPYKLKKQWKHHINATVGFCMHTPFPSSDIYRMFPNRLEVLSSLVCCDLVGFHLFEYARHFYTACRRILGLNH